MTTTGWLLDGRYRVVSRLGTGGVAEVFRAHDELLDRDVAVTVVRTMTDDPDLNDEQRRLRELECLARLSHPNLITLFDGSLPADGPAYLVLELVPGSDLAARLHDGPLPEPQVREIGEQIAAALGYIHARDMVHRDVKPANILLDDSSEPVRARLSDFGVVRMVGGERLTALDLTVGTASYVAPEQARGADVGPAADVYSLGLVLIEALTGVRCFDGPVHEALAARVKRAPSIPPGLPAPWPALLAAMTQLDPAERPTADAVAAALHTEEVVPPPVPAPALAAVPAGAAAIGVASDVFADEPAADTEQALVPPVSRRRHRGALLPLATIAVAAVLAGIGYLLVLVDRGTPSGGTPPVPVTHSSTSRSASHAAKVVRSTTSPAAVPPVVLGPTTHALPSQTKKAKLKQPAPQRTQQHKTASSTAPAPTSSAPPPSSSSPAPTQSPSPTGAVGTPTPTA